MDERKGRKGDGERRKKNMISKEFFTTKIDALIKERRCKKQKSER